MASPCPRGFDYPCLRKSRNGPTVAAARTNSFGSWSLWHALVGRFGNRAASANSTLAPAARAPREQLLPKPMTRAPCADDGVIGVERLSRTQMLNRSGFLSILSSGFAGSESPNRRRTVRIQERNRVGVTRHGSPIHSKNGETFAIHTNDKTLRHPPYVGLVGTDEKVALECARTDMCVMASALEVHLRALVPQRRDGATPATHSCRR